MTDFIGNAFNVVLSANGLNMEIFLFIIVLFFGIIFCIQNYRIGFMAFLMMSIGEFILCYTLGLDWTLSLMSIVLAVVLMAFGIFSNRNSDMGFIA